MVVTIAWLLVAALTIERLVQWSNTGSSWVAVLQTLLPWSIVPAIVWLIVALGAREWWASAALAVAVASLAPLILSWQWTSGSVDGSGRAAVTVVTANVLYDNTRLAAAYDDIAAQDADIVVLSEITDQNLPDLERHDLFSRYRYRIVGSGRGIVILSRLPILADGTSDWTSRDSHAVTVQTEVGAVRLIGSHPATPMTDLERWKRELSAIAADVAAQGRPAIVVGDLNAGWAHPPFRAMLSTAKLTDAMAAAGHPWTMTWPTDHAPVPPFATLDHVLVTDGIGVVDADDFAVTGSDHRALWARLALG